MCVHLYEILAFYIFNVMVGSEELSHHYRSDSIGFLICYLSSLHTNYGSLNLRTSFKAYRQRIHEAELDMQMDVEMDIAPAA